MKGKNNHMVRLSDNLYKKLVSKRAEYINKYDSIYTMSEVIEKLLLEAEKYESSQK